MGVLVDIYVDGVGIGPVELPMFWDGECSVKIGGVNASTYRFENATAAKAFFDCVRSQTPPVALAKIEACRGNAGGGEDTSSPPACPTPF